MNPAEKQQQSCEEFSDYMLWRMYLQQGGSEKALMGLVERYLPLVHRITKRMVIYLPAHMDIEDLLQHGLIGLCEAIHSFEPARGVLFETFAHRRIRGAVLDALRRADHLTRRERSILQKLTRETVEYIDKHGKAPDEKSLAKLADIPLARLNELMAKAQPWLSLDQFFVRGDERGNELGDLLADDKVISPEDEVIMRENREYLREAFRSLPQREQKIMYLYYYEDLTLKEIAAIFDISEARVCQLHGICLLSLRAKLEGKAAG